MAVATEMVQELDLTDQDVSAIAAMIDSEILSHVPDWAPAASDASGIHCGEAVVSSEISSKIKDNGSPVTTKPTTFDTFMFERTSSGRKYWSNSVKAIGGNAPSLHGPSNLSYDRDVAEGGHSGESPQSPLRHFDNGGNLTIKDDSVDTEKSRRGDLGSDGVGQESKDELCAGRGELLPGDNSRSSANVGSENVHRIIKKLEHLLLEQEKELEELRRKHSEAILELLEGLPQDAREVVLTLCKLQAPDHKLWSSIN